MIPQINAQNHRIMLANLFYWVSVYIFLPILPYFYYSNGMSSQNIGLLLGAFSLGALFFKFIAGVLTDYIGCKYISLAGLIISFISVILYLYINNWTLLLIARFIHGIGSALYSSATITMLTLINEKKDVKQIISLYTLRSMLGIGLATGFAHLIYKHSSIYMIVFIGILFSALALVLFPKNATTIALPQPRKRTSKKIIQNVILNLNVIIPTINQFYVYFGYNTVIAFFPIMLLASSETKNYLWVFYLVFSISIILSRLSIKYISHLISQNTAVIVTLSSLSLALILIALYKAIFTLALIGFLVGISVGLSTPILVEMITISTPTSVRGSAIGFFSTAIDLGMGASSILVSIITTHISYKNIFLLLFIISTAYTVLFILSSARLYKKNALL